ncbi:MAG: histidine utilization repressor protein [Rhodospirillaceae bacterium]|nr:MAG: histidine utilization repressor protein [Rhodospirillaceae bacterium]
MTAAPASLHQRILGDLQGKILSGKLAPGARIATEHELAEAYDCSRMTVSNVLAKLARAGLVERRRKAGTFVTRPQSQAAVLEIHDIKAEVQALGQAYRFELLSRDARRSTAADRERLVSKSAGRVVELVVRHFAGDRVFCLEDRLINAEAVPQAVHECFDDVAPGRWLLDSVPWTAAEHRIGASSAGKERATLLSVPANTACLIVERRTWRAALPVTHVRLTYPGDSHQLVAHFTPTQT